LGGEAGAGVERHSCRFFAEISEAAFWDTDCIRKERFESRGDLYIKESKHRKLEEIFIGGLGCMGHQVCDEQSMGLFRQVIWS
jgi:hypothetical protein